MAVTNFNKSFLEGIFAGNLNHPFKQKADITLVKNYRPVSILSSISKILEK